MKESSLEIYESRLEKALEYIDENLGHKILLEDLAKEAFFSPFHFHRIFSSLQKEPLNEYVNRIKLEKASQQLTFTNKSIKEISYSLGYSSNSVFYRAFKNHFECTPSFY